MLIVGRATWTSGREPKNDDGFAPLSRLGAETRGGVFSPPSDAPSGLSSWRGISGSDASANFGLSGSAISGRGAGSGAACYFGFHFWLCRTDFLAGIFIDVKYALRADEHVFKICDNGFECPPILGGTEHQEQDEAECKRAGQCGQKALLCALHRGMGQTDGLQLEGWRVNRNQGEGDFYFMPALGEVRPEFGKPREVLFGDKNTRFVEDMAFVEAIDDFARGQFEMARWRNLPDALLKSVDFRWGDIPLIL